MTINLAENLRLLGASGLRVSPLTLGTMTFGDGWWRAGQDNARAIFTAYLEAGGNSVDTADVYGGGRAEELLGEFMAATRFREQLIVATKASAPTGVGPDERGNGGKHLLAALGGSLRRLRTDYIDVFWLHLWDGITPVADVMATMAQIVADGKARTVGLSNVPAWYATAAHALADRHGWAAPVALQLEYSLRERTAETEHVPAAQHYGMSLVPWSPLANGFLTSPPNTPSASERGKTSWPSGCVRTTSTPETPTTPQLQVWLKPPHGLRHSPGSSAGHSRGLSVVAGTVFVMNDPAPPANDRQLRSDSSPAALMASAGRYG